MESPNLGSLRVAVTNVALTEVIDLTQEINILPYIYTDSDGTSTVQMSTSNNGTAFTPYIDISVTQTRYIKFKLAFTNTSFVNDIIVNLTGKSKELILADLDTTKLSYNDGIILPARGFSLIGSITVVMQNVGPGFTNLVSRFGLTAVSGICSIGILESAPNDGIPFTSPLAPIILLIASFIFLKTFQPSATFSVVGSKNTLIPDTAVNPNLDTRFNKIINHNHGSTSPPAPKLGQIWHDSEDSVLKVYGDDGWQPLGGKYISLVTGDIIRGVCS
jgi:hypothetical protein